MENLLKHQFVAVVNTHRNKMAPEWTSEPVVRMEDIADYRFDVIDPKNAGDTIKCPYGHGTATYLNGQEGNTYTLRFIAYEDYLNQFVFDDGQHKDRKMLPKVKNADLLVYNTDGSHVYFFVQELCEGDVANKRSVAKIQLNTTLNLLYQSAEVRSFIDSFEKKMCFVSAKDGRVASPNNVADGFMQAYDIIPEPLPFSFGRIGALGFEAYESSIIELGKKVGDKSRQVTQTVEGQ